MTRWGIAGTGGIATRFMNALQDVTGGSAVAVCSRTSDRATRFGAEHGIPTCYGSYEDLAADESVDVVYVATPHPRHLDDTLLYLAAGKHVLCEKPFAMNQVQAERMVAAARAGERFLMEAIWSRFLPAYRTLRELLDEGRIGDPLMVEADFGFRVPIDPAHRLFDPALGGGALLDLGIYPLQLASFVLGSPEKMAAFGHLGTTGVDEQVAAVLRYSDGQMAVLKAAIRTPLSCRARISGSNGAIELPAFMHCPESITVEILGQRERIGCPIEGRDGLRYEIEEVQRCLDAGLVESPLMPLAETLALAGQLDALRGQIGLRYEWDSPGGAMLTP